MARELTKTEKGIVGAVVGAHIGAIVVIVVWMAIRYAKREDKFYQDVENVASNVGSTNPELATKIRQINLDLQTVNWDEIALAGGIGLASGIVIGAGIGYAAGSLAVALVVGLAVAVVVTALILYAIQAHDKKALQKAIGEAAVAAGGPIGEANPTVAATRLDESDTGREGEKIRRADTFVSAYSPRLAEDVII